MSMKPIELAECRYDKENPEILMPLVNQAPAIINRQYGI
jgi:hypothetical protein